jgi:selenophosphate synthetase-related protein
MTEDNRSYLIRFINDLKNFENVERKTILFPIMDKIRKNSFRTDEIFSDMGEDAAGLILRENKDELILLTTDAITEEFSKKSPWAAGFSAIMACADDIYACGGTPIAASAIISSDQPKIRDQLLNGILEATHRFEIPLIRGHTSDKTSNIGVSATVIGKIKKNYYISAGGAQTGDTILIIADFEGRVGKSSKYYWDTVTYKSKEEILGKKQIMQKIAQKKLVHASKDVSNGGIFGTLLLLLQYSKKGAIIDLELIKAPKGVITPVFGLIDFVKMYLTSAFLVTTSESNYGEIKKIGSEHGLIVYKIGNITENTQIQLKYRDTKEVYMDLTFYL